VESTFDTIIANVQGLVNSPRLFSATLRVNYDRDSLGSLREFTDWLAAELNGDHRFRVDFQPIWADEGTVPVSLCLGKERQRTQLELLEHAHRMGLRIAQALDAFSPGGYVCYAAKANSLVVRADGQLNKCTVALDDPRNHVGMLSTDGALHLDLDKFTLWTGSGLEEDLTCQACFMSPSCQGNSCPLERIANGKRPCPSAKHFAPRILPMLID
jgi:uncharacterized protein